MTQKIRNDMNTDTAWHRLYARLQSDGLVPETARHESLRRFALTPLKLAAAIAIPILFAGAFALTFALLHKDGKTGDTPLLALHNEKGSATLVTTLEDGSIVYLAGGSRLYYPENFPEDKREVSLDGRAMFDVQSNRERPFTITTGAAQIEVTGTVFDVWSADAGTFELSVKQGEVKITSIRDGRRLYAKAGETVSLTPGGRLVHKETSGNPFRPYDGHIRFKDEKLINILHIINSKQTGLTLQTTPSLENRKITVTFTDATPESVAELICVAFNLLYKKNNNTLLITEP
jgi:ferric-dicitrate binding protein FerR (iron transport regulator)